MAYDAAYYRGQAARAQAEADAATLANVRERALRSVAAFETMAANLERVARRRAEREANGGVSLRPSFTRERES
ncbi:hypothetical protein [Sphingomonas sp. DT-204]|uniref:hypothetical protein n=1 Tax=Sphingomonas sp. DT-204 TaxID=3396166 RepID=UPI003F1B7C62